MNVLERVAQAKAEAEERLSRGGGTRAQFWKPKDGANLIRILPAWTDKVPEFAAQFWREVAQHWNVSSDQKGPILCPRKTPGLSGPCPICELVDELKKDKANVQAKSVVKEIRAKTTYLFNIVDSKDPEYTAQDVATWTTANPGEDCPFAAGDMKIQVYAAPLTVYDTILGIITTGSNDITRLEEGRGVTITRFPNKDPKKTRYQVTPEMSPSAINVGDREFPQLHQMGFTMAYDEMLDLLHSGVGGDFVASLPDGNGATGALPAVNTNVTQGAEAATAENDVDLEAQLREAAQS
jgi:hypothetical protein